MLWSILLWMSHRTELTNVSAPTMKLPRCSSRAQDFAQRNCKIRVLSRNLKSLSEEPEDHRLLAANLIVFKDWLESTAFMHEDLLAQTNSKFQSCEKPKKVLLHPFLMILTNQKKRIQNVPSKMDSTPFGVARNLNQWSWTSNENMCRNSDCVSTAGDLATVQRIAKAELAACPIGSLHHWRQCNSMFTRNWSWGPDCRSARVERSLHTSEELAKSELQSKRSASNSWTRLLRHLSPIEFKKSDDRTSPWAVNLKIRWALSDPLPAKQAATLATTATSVSEDKLAGQLSKWWDIESYASNCDVTGQAKNKLITIKT